MTPATLRRHTIELRTMACGTYAPALGVRVSLGKSINSLINHNKTSLAPRRGIAPIRKIKHLAKSGKDSCSVSFREFLRRSFPPARHRRCISLQRFSLVRSPYVPLPAPIALIGIIPAISVRDSVGLIGGDLSLFLARIWNFAGGAKKVAVPGVPEPAGWTEMRAREAITRLRRTDRFKLG